MTEGLKLFMDYRFEAEKYGISYNENYGPDFPSIVVVLRIERRT